jgi:hypothetical protein
MPESNTQPTLPKFRKAFESDSFKRDAQVFLTVGDDAFHSVVEQLELTYDILSTKGLREIIVQAGVTNETQSRLLVSIVPVFARWGRTIAQGKTEALLATVDIALERDFSEAERSILATRFTTLLEGTFPGLALADKADTVSRATGRKLRNAQLITDIRPVFDESREHILAVVPMTTLKLTTESSEEGMPVETCEVQLSESELGALIDKLVEAQRKLDATKKLLRNRSIDIAECAMVVADEEGT